jgi:hypothetical protein
MMPPRAQVAGAAGGAIWGGIKGAAKGGVAGAVGGAAIDLMQAAPGLLDGDQNNDNSYSSEMSGGEAANDGVTGADMGYHHEPSCPLGPNTAFEGPLNDCTGVTGWDRGW